MSLPTRKSRDPEPPRAAAPDWTGRLAAGLFAALVLAAAAALWRGGGALYFGPADSDLTNYFYPQRVFLCRWLDRGVAPWWNPHLFCGYPTLEIQQHAMFHPASIAPAALLGPERSLLAQAALALALGAALTWIALRRCFGLAPAAAAVGAGAWVFGGTFATRIAGGHLTVALALAVLPLGALTAFDAAARLSRQPGPRAAARAVFARPVRERLLLAGAAGAWMILSGAPQYVVFLAWAQIVILLAAARRRAWVAAGMFFALSWGLAAALSAPQWLPALAYLPWSSRGNEAMGLIGSRGDLTALFAEILLPNPFGDGVTRAHLATKSVWDVNAYAGVGLWILAAGGLWRFAARPARRTRRARAAFAVTALGAYLCVGGWIPGLGSFRDPLKARALLALGLTLFAALSPAWRGADAAGALRRLRFERWLCVCAALACAGGAALLTLRPELVSEYLRRLPPPQDLAAAAPWRRALADPVFAARPVRDSLAAAAGLALLMSALIFPRRPRVRAQNPAAFDRAARLALPALLLLDPFAASLQCVISRHPFEAATAPARDWEALFAPALAATRAALEPPWRITPDSAIINRSLHTEGIFETGGYDPLLPHLANKRVVLRGQNMDQPIETRSRMTSAALGRRYVAREVFGAVSDFTDPSGAWWEFPGAALATLERRARAGRLPEEVFGPDIEGISWVAPGSSRPEKFTAKGEPARTEMDAGFEAEMEAIRRAGEAVSGDPPLRAGEWLRLDGPARLPPHEMRFRARLDAPALLLARVTWLPGWRVRVNGGPWSAPLFANHWMLAVALPAGESRVEFRYRPQALGASIALAVAACALCLAALAAGRGRAPHGGGA